MKKARNFWRAGRVTLAAMAFCIMVCAALFPKALPQAFLTQGGSVFLAVLANASIGAMAALASILMLTAVFGRVYCSVICPLGILQDIIGHFHAGKHSFAPWKRHIRWPVFCLTVAAAFFGLMLPLTLLMPSSNVVIICNNVLREVLQLADNQTAILPEPITISPMPGAQLAGWLLLFALVALTQWRGRIFCNTLCPVGTVLGVLSRKALFRMTLDTEKCVHCHACERRCKADCIDSTRGVIHNNECVMCMNCIDACPKGAIAPRHTGIRGAKFDPHRRFFLEENGLALTGFLLGAAAKAVPRNMTEVLPVMPPGAGTLERFNARCLGCGLCIGACTGKVLKAAVTEYGLKGFMQPVMDHYRGACDFDCNACSNICPCGALQPLSLKEKQTTRVGLAHWNASLCVAALMDEDCGACSEHCPVGALTMEDNPGKEAKVPRVNPDLCIGCGACQNICPIRPVAAITVHGVTGQSTVTPPTKTSDVKLRAEDDFPF